MVNTRPRRALGCAPADRIPARLGRDHYIRLDDNDYSVHPAVVGRRIEIIADLDRVRDCM